MAKKIFLEDCDIKELMRSSAEKFELEIDKLRSSKMQTQDDRKISINLDVNSNDDREASILFSPMAWCKMYALVNHFASEVEWHGVVRRTNSNVFVIDDILVFPHTVTGSTVVSDQNEYESWLNELDDETFNSLRFHGHSHVMMDVTPSGVDMTYRKKILDNFGRPSNEEDYFYIFLITNKKLDLSAEIYDITNNALYSTKDKNIDIDVIFNNDDWLSIFMENAQNLVKTYVPPKKTTPASAKSPEPPSLYSGYEYNRKKFREENQEQEDFFDELYRNGGY